MGRVSKCEWGMESAERDVFQVVGAVIQRLRVDGNIFNSINYR